MIVSRTSEDLLLVGQCLRPIWIQVEAEGVKVNWNIRSAAWIGVDSPSPPQAFTLVVNFEVGVAKLMLESMRHGDGGHTAANNDGIWRSHGSWSQVCKLKDREFKSRTGVKKRGWELSSSIRIWKHVCWARSCCCGPG